MKTILLASLLALVTLTTSATSSNSSKKVSYKTAQNFQREFGEVKDVDWSDAANNMSKATFKSGNETVNAFFSSDGEFIASTVNITVNDLPAALRVKVKAATKDAAIVEVIKVQGDGDNAYYVKLRAAKGDIVLKGYGNGYLRETDL